MSERLNIFVLDHANGWECLYAGEETENGIYDIPGRGTIRIEINGDDAIAKRAALEGITAAEAYELIQLDEFNGDDDD